jgi:hypothetical protein
VDAPPIFRPSDWVLADGGRGLASDIVVITSAAAHELRVFGFHPDPATEAHGFSGAYLAPRWLLEFVGATVLHANVRPYGPSDPVATALADALVERAERVIQRGLDDPAWAAAMLVALQVGGLPAVAPMLGGR